MFTILNPDNWHRKDAFYFFKQYEDPYFNITAPVDVTSLLQRAKAENSSFFLHSLHLATKTANALEAFRLRLATDELRCYDMVHCGSTVLMPDNSFRFCYFDYVPERSVFVENGGAALERLKSGQPALDPRDAALDMLHFSVIPWIPFTAFKHARRFAQNEGIPKIVFGQYYQDGSRWLMPVSVEVHHALMDGYDLGLFFEKMAHQE